jgi:DNA-binding response OmpR family regulator
MASSKPRVLVVDDEPSVLATLQSILAQAGYEAVATGTCSEALDQVRDRSFDVVLSDLRLEDGDGMTIVDEARRRSPATSVILLTGYGSLESAIGALRHGASDYLLKPCNVDQLCETVARGVQHAQALHFSEQQRHELASANAGLVAMNADLQRRVDQLLARAQDHTRVERALADVSRVLADASNCATVLHDIARLVVPDLADFCGIDLAEGPADHGRLVRAAVAHVTPERERELAGLPEHYTVDLGSESEIAQVLRTGEPVLLDTIDDLFLSTRARVNQPGDVLPTLRPRSAMFVPLAARGCVLGVLLLAWGTARRLGLEDATLAEDLAARVAGRLAIPG